MDTPLPGLHFPTLAGWRLTLGGGQCFRWNAQLDGSWQGSWNTHAIAVQRQLDGSVFWRRLTPHTTEAEVLRYFASDIDFSALHEQLPWRSDPVLAGPAASLRGLRILRQPLGETLLCYQCSATKRISQIRQVCQLLAARFGQTTPAGHALPSWPRLAEVPEAQLRACGLGYRARHIAAAARELATLPDWEKQLAAMSTPQARDFLVCLPGVGPKIADCVLLYALARHEVFPIDTWVRQCLTRRYALQQWSPAQIAHFARLHFGPAAGLAQQYLFENERLQGQW